MKKVSIVTIFTAMVPDDCKIDGLAIETSGAPIRVVHVDHPTDTVATVSGYETINVELDET